MRAFFYSRIVISVRLSVQANMQIYILDINIGIFDINPVWPEDARNFFSKKNIQFYKISQLLR